MTRRVMVPPPLPGPPEPTEVVLIDGLGRRWEMTAREAAMLSRDTILRFHAWSVWPRPSRSAT